MSKPNPDRHKICLFGHFGAANYGNEATLEALLYHLRGTLPDAEIFCICSAPQTVASDYKLVAMPITSVVVKPWNTHNPILRLARKLFIGIPSEIYRWLKGVRTLHGTDLLVVAGTGLLTDAFCIGGWGPYSTFKWSVIARLSGCRLVFASVGAGPLTSPAGQFLIKSALSLASFRSYRDEATLQHLAQIGFNSNGDKVYPDLAFGLPSASPREATAPGRRPVVGLGVMLFEGMYGIENTTRDQYTAYVEVLVDLAAQLLDRGYDIRMIIGDHLDVPITQEFVSLVKERSTELCEGRIVAEPIASTKDLLAQLAATDYVVATRFHNVLLALFLNKPSISISFHHKCSSLMSQMGMSEYCQDIRRLDRDLLMEQFCGLEKNAEKLRQLLREKVTDCRKALDEQYDAILGDLL